MKYLEIIKENIWLFFILLVATVLRFYHLDFQGAWLDEVHTLKESDPNLTFSEFHKIIMFREGIPHFYFLLIKIFSQIFGINSIFIARAFSAIPGILSVLYIYFLGKELYNKNVGLLCSIFLTVNVLSIEYSQEARSYSLLALLVIISFYRLILFLKNNSIKNAIILGFIAGLITNAHPIGLINVAAIYFILLLAIVIIKDKRILIFKNSVFAGIITLLVFSPVYQIVKKVAEIKSFWVEKPSFDNIKILFINLSGKSEVLLYLILISIFSLFIITIISLKKNKSKIEDNKIIISFTVLFIWFFVEVSILLIKSYSGTSLILNRYFIAVMPAMMLFLAIGIEIISNKVIKILVSILTIGILFYQIFYPVNYYTALTKSQFSIVCEEVLSNNKENEKIITNWGWLLSYYLDRENKLKNVNETNLESYLQQVKEKAIDAESFWYIDGNSRPFSLNEDIEKFVADKFLIEKTITYHDAWAKHFVLKNPKPKDPLKIELSKFNNSNFDGIGNLMFFENSKITYPNIDLKKGKYQITIIGNSLPFKPLNNENAKLNIFLNQILIKSIEMSEKPNSENIINFEHKLTSKLVLSIAFINDFSNADSDRNVQISKIILKKIE